MSMFTQALEKAFDAYFYAKYGPVDLNHPNILAIYREEMNDFAGYLVQEYEGFVATNDWVDHEGISE